MRTVISRLLLLMLLILPLSELSAQLELPRISQKASVMQRIGLLDVTITYSRPNVKDRKIWGDLVPYNEVWRTGADEATTVSFSDDVRLNGNKLPAGKYSLFTLPAKDKWTVIINKTAKQWGAFTYDSTKDILRFKVKPQVNKLTESLEYSFENVTASSADLEIKWEKLKVPFRIEFDVDAKAYSNIQKALKNASPDDEIVYAASANYAADNNVHKDESMKWIDKSISIKPTFYNYFVKAKLLAADGKSKEAMDYLEKSRKLGKTDPDYIPYIPQIDKLMSDLQAKKSK